MKYPCKFCTASSCYHCGECGALVFDVHKKTCSNYIATVCVACVGTGKNSKGGDCYVCVVHNFKKEKSND